MFRWIKWIYGKILFIFGVIVGFFTGLFYGIKYAFRLKKCKHYYEEALYYMREAKKVEGTQLEKDYLKKSEECVKKLIECLKGNKKDWFKSIKILKKQKGGKYDR